MLPRCKSRSFSWQNVSHQLRDPEHTRLDDLPMDTSSSSSVTSTSAGGHPDLPPDTLCRPSRLSDVRSTCIDLRLMQSTSSPKQNGGLVEHSGCAAKPSVQTPENRHAARLGLPGSPGIAIPDFTQLLEQLIWCLEQRSPKELDSHEVGLLDRVLALSGYEFHRAETTVERKLSRRTKHPRKALKGNDSANAMLRIAWDIYNGAGTEDQLAMLLNAHLPTLLAIDECTLFRLEKDHLFDLHASIKREVRGIVGWVASTGKPLRTGCPESEADLFDAEIDIANASAYLCLPLALRGTVYGVLRVCRIGKDEPPFTDEEQALLEQAACLLGEALRYMSLADAMVFEKQKNSFMVELAGSLSSVEIDCDRLVKMVLDYARTLTHADRCSLFLVDAKHQRLEAYFEGGTVVKMAINQGIAGHVAMTGDVVNIADVYNDERFNRKVDIQTGYHTESLLCLPILYEREVVAVAQLVNKLEADGQTVTQFTAKDVEVFQAFSGYAAVSLRNARLFRKADLEQRKSVCMLQLAHHLAAEALDKARLAQSVMQHAKAITGADHCSLFVLASDGNDVTLEAYGADDQMVRLPLNSGVAGDVVMSGEAINITDAFADHRFGHAVGCYERCQIKTVLAVPVKCAGTIVAVLQVVNKLDKFGQTVRFTHEDEDVLASFALYAGVSLRTARMFATSHAERQTCGALLEQTVALQHTILARQSLVPRITEAAGSLAHAERCVLGIVDPSGRHLLLYSAGSYRTTIPTSGHTLEAQVLAAMEVCCLNNITADQRAKWGDIDSVDKSLLLVPILLNGKGIGVLRAVNRRTDDPQRHAFQQEDINALTAFACSVAVSLALEREYRTAKILEAGAHALTTTLLDERRMLDTLLASAQQIVGAEAASLFVLQGREFHVTIQGDTEPLGNARIKVSHKRIEGLAALTKAAVNVPDVVADGRFLSGMEGQHGQRPKCILCVPVIHTGLVVAVLQVVNKVDGVFTAEDEALLSSFAACVGGCFVVSRRYTTVTKSQQQNERAMTVLLKLMAAQPRDVSALMDLLTEGAKTLLGCERSTAFVADRERHLLYTKSKQKVLGKQLEASLNMGLATEVVKTGKVINLKDAYLDKRFCRDIDSGHEVRTRSIIAMPLQYHDEVVGVIQVMNQGSRGIFSKHDEFLLATLVYLGNHLVANRRLFDFFIEELGNAMGVIRALVGRTLPERTSGSPRIPDASILSRCLQMVIPEKEASGSKALDFNVLEYKNAAPDSNKSLSLIRLVVNMFVDLGVTAAFNIPLRTLASFVLRVRSLCRPNSFHNFLHACDMAHVMYCLLRILANNWDLDALDRLVLLVATLVHHVDHIGINSSFHFRCDGMMGDLRSTVHPSLSMGLHHCATALYTVMQPDANIFATLDDCARTQAIVMLIDLTLFTERSCPGLEAALFPPTPTARHTVCQPSANVSKALLLNALMATAELSAVLRPFDVAQEWAFYRTEEFYGKGDLAKDWYEEDCVADVSGLASAQVQFLDAVAIPHLILMAQLTPGVLPWLGVVQGNRDLWQDLVGCEGEEILVQPAPLKFRGRRH